MTPSWLSSDELATWKAFLAVSKGVDAAIDNDMRRDGKISLAEYEILAILSEQPDGRMRMGALARAMITAKSALTYKVASLERLNYVRRVPRLDDARGLDAELTSHGWRFVVATAPRHVESVRRHLVDILSDEDLATLRRLSLLLLGALGPSSCVPDNTCPTHLQTTHPKVSSAPTDCEESA